ncbi:cytochrome c oxidase assembly protein COX16 homolog, mitochondrial isoform X1 [Arvicanthis niloticus]|uniref:cytochrome c oxidase assembly protein COX16 homolog, mitochondrial isoform X1 n=1 Tax=Arvicanthis niloticus TaxID=61156 RepID=UPI00402B8F80
MAYQVRTWHPKPVLRGAVALEKAKPAAASAMVAPAVLRALRKNKTLRYGVPMLLLVVGGSFGLREFSQIRYDAVTVKDSQSRLASDPRRSTISASLVLGLKIDPELEKKLKVNKITLESEYEKIKDSTFENWKNIRGPRPWEDPQLLQGRNPETLKPKTT